jgi:hypothetical protein
MEKEFVPYEQALALKELGFDDKCLSCYLYETETFSWELNYQISNNKIPWIIAAPLYQQAFRWFREKYKVYTQHDSVLTGHSQGHRFMLKDSAYLSIVGTTWCKTYEEAELECLKKLIEIVKNK